MTKDEQIAQIKFFTGWIKEQGLNPKLWNDIDALEKRLIGQIIDEDEYNPV